MYPYNTNNNINQNIDRTKKSIRATKKEFPDPLDSITDTCPSPNATTNTGSSTNNNMPSNNQNNNMPSNNQNNNMPSNNQNNNMPSNNQNCNMPPNNQNNNTPMPNNQNNTGANPDRVRENLSQIFSSAMADEATNAAKYKGMMEYLNRNGIGDLSEVAKSMYTDGNKHVQLLKDMAQEDGIQVKDPGNVTVDFDYTPAGILENIYSEIQGARFYRDFGNVLRNENMGNPEDVDEMMTDEQNHAVLNNYIYLRMTEGQQ
jgi:hypothetical protein